MSKKSKGSGKKNKPGQARSLVFQDLTAERYFQSQMTKALKLGKDEHYFEAMEILEPLEEKYADRSDFHELLGVVQYSLQEYEAAREAFAKALELDPAEKRTRRTRANGPLIQFNLASSYAMSGYPLLAYEMMQQIDSDSLEDLPGNRLDPETCREFSRVCDKSVTIMAEKKGIPREEFLAYGLALEKGNLALPRFQPSLARLYYEEAAQLRPHDPEPFRGLSAAYTLEGNHVQARQQLEHILEKISPDNLEVLSSLVRLLVTHGENEDSKKYEPQLAGLGVPEGLADRIILAGTWAYLEDDRHVFELVEPLLNTPDLREELINFDGDWEPLELYAETLLLGTVAATHLGRKDQAIEWFHQEAEEDLVGEVNAYYMPLQRTWIALENNEIGPRPGERFFYDNPQMLLTTALLGQLNLLDMVRNGSDDPDLNTRYGDMFEKHGALFIEVLVYDAWVERALEKLAPILEVIFKLETRDTPEGEPLESPTIRRLAFTQAGDALLHLAALANLIKHEVVRLDEPHTIWLGDQQVTGVLDELTTQAVEWSERQNAAYEAGETED